MPPPVKPKKQKKRIVPRNLAAQSLRSGLFRAKVEKKRDLYSRKALPRPRATAEDDEPGGR